MARRRRRQPVTQMKKRRPRTGPRVKTQSAPCGNMKAKARPTYEQEDMARFVAIAEIGCLQALYRQGKDKLRELGLRENNRITTKLPIVQGKIDYSTRGWVDFIDNASHDVAIPLQRLVAAIRKRLRTYE